MPRVSLICSPVLSPLTFHAHDIKSKVLHASSELLAAVCSDETKALSVVAIELQDPATRAVRVFSPTKDKPEVWEVRLNHHTSADVCDMLMHEWRFCFLCSVPLV